MRYFTFLFIAIIIIGTGVTYYLMFIPVNPKRTVAHSITQTWQAPDINLLPATPEADLIRYGKELIANTSAYLGPRGTVAKISNGMNCQNCHLDAGARLYGNCLASVAATYPKYRSRSGRVESIEYRIDECMERSLNGKKLDSLSKEMRAMVAYLKWLGKDVNKETAPAGINSHEIAFIDRAADPVAGKNIFLVKCKTCHGENGQGLLKQDSSGYLYPPLWGPNSFNVSAGLYRLSRFATFVKYNMPYNIVRREPQLTDEEAWDLAAFVNSQERPEKFFKYDWSNISSKPVDYPFGPYADSFSAMRHKFGPFKGMERKK